MRRARTTAWIFGCVSAGALFCGASSGQSITGYHIGNSLTWDGQPLMMAAYAADQGRTVSAGYHINCNRSLDIIWNLPEQTCIEPDPGFGYYGDALPAMDLDYVTMQPWPRPSSTMRNDLRVIGLMTDMLRQNPANHDTTLYIYQGWLSRDGIQDRNGDGFSDGDPTGNSSSGTGESDDQPSDALEADRRTLEQQTQLTDGYFAELFTRVRGSVENEVRLIPVGPVLKLIRERKDNGEFEELYGIWRMYRDEIHMSYGIGRFTASATAASVLMDVPPFGMHTTWIDAFGDDGYDIRLYMDIEQAIWDTISTDPRTGVNPCLADTNRDGVATPADFNAWIFAFNGQRSIADQNRDGEVTPADFNAWISAFNAGC